MGELQSSCILSLSCKVLPTGVPESCALNVDSDSSKSGGLLPRATVEDLRVFP